MTIKDFATISLLLLSSCVFIAGFIGVVTIYVIGTRKGMKEGNRLVKVVEKFAKDHQEPLPIKTRLLVGLYLLISLIGMGSTLFIIIVILSHEVGLPFADNFSAETLGIISGTVLVLAILATLALRLMFGKIFKSR